MVTVGIKNLKNSLSRYINIVKTGEKVLITDHNKIVAELGPSFGVSSGSGLLKEYLDDQVSKGAISRSTKRTKINNREKVNKYDNLVLEGIYLETRDER